MRDWPRLLPMTTAMMRQGCWRLAALAAWMASSASCSSTTIRRGSTRPRAIAPVSCRSATSFLLMATVVVLGRSTITGVPDQCQSEKRARVPRSPWANWVGWSRHPPDATVTAHHLVRAGRSPAARDVGLQLGARLGPVLLDRVEDLPGELDLLVPREQWWVTEQDVEDEPLVGLGARLGERPAVAEVHGHVAHLHLGARHLGPEPHGDALVRLHPDDDGVLPELFSRSVVEGQVRRLLEHHGDLGHPLSE